MKELIERVKQVKGIFYVIALIVVVVMTQVIVNYAFRDEYKLIEGFAKSEATPVISKLQVVGNFGVKYMTKEDKEQLIDYVSSRLGIKGTLDKNVVMGDKTVSIVAKQQAEDAEAAIETISVDYEQENNVVETTQYLYVTMEFHNDNNSILEYKKMIEDTFDEIGLTKMDSSVLLEGKYDGALNLQERNEITDKVMKELQADVVSENRTESLYTVYGYTSLIDDFIISEEKRVNVNIAFTYKESEDETLFYVASPIINSEY